MNYLETFESYTKNKKKEEEIEENEAHQDEKDNTEYHHANATEKEFQANPEQKSKIKKP